MALFESKEKKQISKAVRPTVVRTQNVAKELQAIAKSYEVRVDTLDFNILEVQTYIRINDGTKETEWESVNDDNTYTIKTDLEKDAIGTGMSVEVTEIDIDGEIDGDFAIEAVAG